MEHVKKTRFRHGLITLVVTIMIMFVMVVGFDASPHVPLILGCTFAGLMAKYLGYRWEDILDGILQGIIPSLEAMLILILIGILIAAWIGAGTVPAMIYYGLELISAKYFVVAVMIICSVIAMAVGSWGTAGTVGLAFMGIGAVLQINPALTAGAIISGAYMGEALSPLSDATNLVAAVGRESVFDVSKHEAKLVLPAYIAAAAAFTIVGRMHAPKEGTAIQENIEPLMNSLQDNFYISPLDLIPMFLMVGCILIKVPAIPSIMVGIGAAMVQAAAVQKADISLMIESCYSGYVSDTGEAMIDNLLSAGGITAMMYSVTVVLMAMAFGGLMQKTHQMEAVITPILGKIESGAGMVRVTALTCILMNTILPDQYLGISVPGQMYGEEYEKRDISRLFLTDTLSCAATVTSPLIPWNTCGAYMMTVLGVSAMEYMKFAYFNILSIIVVLTAGVVLASADQKKARKNRKL